MGNVYRKAGQDIHDQAERLIMEHYEVFKEVGLTIDFVFAHAELGKNGEPSGPAIMYQGYPADGLCRALPLKDRAMGRADAEITLDGDRWPQMTAEQQDALLDHELYH